MSEEGGLVDALGADNRKDGLVLHFVVHPHGDHADEPFVERPLEVGLSFSQQLWRFVDMNVTGQGCDAIDTIPIGQAFDELPYGMHFPGKVALEYTLNVGLQHALARVDRYLLATGVDFHLINGLPFG